MVTDEDFKIVEARLQYDIDNNINTKLKLGILTSEKKKETSKN